MKTSIKNLKVNDWGQFIIMQFCLLGYFTIPNFFGINYNSMFPLAVFNLLMAVIGTYQYYFHRQVTGGSNVPKRLSKT